MDTPSIHLKLFSDEQYFLDKVFYSNCYKIKGFKETEFQPTILDFGASNGVFSLFTLCLGAKKVYAFEIQPENFKSLIKNTSNPHFNDKVEEFNVGVYTSNTSLTFSKNPKIKDNSLLVFGDINLEPEDWEETYSIPVFTLDYILKNIVKEEIDLLKLNIGYAEIQILKESSLLVEKVSNICVETEESSDIIKEFVAAMYNKGFEKTEIGQPDEDGKTIIWLSRNKLSDVFLIE
jgi:FkbM family methyltransferase